ncbi:MAG: hypothetical protein HQM06_16080 [Magnetococcales bacterium]|nr:hypothetical protein [Magnetococcales bacterium]
MKATISSDGEFMTVRIPMRIKQGKVRAKIILPPDAPDWAPPPPTPHQAILKALGRARRWSKMIQSGQVKSMKELAEREQMNDSYISRILRLNQLAPDIIIAILDGRQPETLTLADLMEPFSMVWEEQRVQFGFPAVSYPLNTMKS